MKLLLLWEIVIVMIIGNRTLRCPVQSVIILVINKLDSAPWSSDFINHLCDYRTNWMTQCLVTIIHCY